MIAAIVVDSVVFVSMHTRKVARPVDVNTVRRQCAMYVPAGPWARRGRGRHRRHGRRGGRAGAALDRVLARRHQRPQCARVRPPHRRQLPLPCNNPGCGRASPTHPGACCLHAEGRMSGTFDPGVNSYY